MKYYTFYKHLHWTFILKATDKGLSSLHLYENDDLSKLEHNEEKMKPFVTYLDSFFKGEITNDIPLDIKGTKFQMAVWCALMDILPGETASYQDIAESINNPKAVQAVGNAVGSNPVMLFIPCHRIIKKDGSIGGFSSDPKLKAYLLNYESEQNKHAHR